MLERWVSLICVWWWSHWALWHLLQSQRAWTELCEWPVHCAELWIPMPRTPAAPVSMHTLLSGLSSDWSSTWELQSQFFFLLVMKSTFLLLSHSHWWAEPQAWHKPFIPDRTPLVPREQTAGGPHAHPETGVLQVILQETTPTFPALETSLMAYSSEHDCCVVLSDFMKRCVIFSS